MVQEYNLKVYLQIYLTVYIFFSEIREFFLISFYISVQFTTAHQQTLTHHTSIIQTHSRVIKVGHVFERFHKLGVRLVGHGIIYDGYCKLNIYYMYYLLELIMYILRN